MDDHAELVSLLKSWTDAEDAYRHEATPYFAPANTDPERTLDDVAVKRLTALRKIADDARDAYHAASFPIE